MSDEAVERYLVSRHESVHLLAAVQFGNDVVSVDIDRGESVLAWPIHAYQVPRLPRNHSAKQQDTPLGAAMSPGQTLPSPHETRAAIPL